VSRTRKSTRRHKAARPGLNSLKNVAIDAEDVGIDAEARKKRQPSYPTEPHPDNVALAATYPPSELGMPVLDWLRQRIAAMAARKNPETSFYAWCGWLTTCEQLEKRLADCVRFPTEQPLSPATLATLRLVLVNLRQDLEDNRPF
jgi:hypothetical protein